MFDFIFKSNYNIDDKSIKGVFMLKKEELIKLYGDGLIEIQKLLKSLKAKHNSEKELFLVAQSAADIIMELKLDKNSVLATIIYVYCQKFHETADEFAQDKDIKKLIDMLFKCDEFARNYTDADGLKNMLIAIAKDIRVIIIKSAQVLAFARNWVTEINSEKAIALFKIIDDIYAPIAARLGLSEIKSELQDLSFQFHSPEEFKELSEAVKKEYRASSEMINEMVHKIKDLVKKNGIYCKCYGRVKHISSINNKIKSRRCTLKSIYDIAAVRILVDNVSECYQALGIIHSNFVPVDGRFKDYIAHPKPNGYKSIHTTVYYDNEFFEVQIRTNSMHEFAEYGIAAHFLYKEKKSKLNTFDSKLLWIRKLLENKDNLSSNSLLEELKTDVYLGEIFVQTPKGKVIKLVENATPIDFAYAIHSDIGNMCTGAKVNGVMVPLTSVLSNGDVVEILTTQNSKGPSRDWLKIVKMQSTKDKINIFFKRQMKEENIKLGKSIVEQCAKSLDVQLSSIWQEKWVNKVLQKSSFVSVDELFASIGYGSVSAEKVLRRLIGLKQQEENARRSILDEIGKTPLKFDNKSKIAGVEGSLTNFCRCCNPIPGDDIIGYVSRGRGIIIHKTSCENMSHLQKDRLINVDWNLSGDEDFTFTSSVDVVAKNTSNVYIEITMALNELGIKVMSLNSNQNKNDELLLKIGVIIKNKTQLQQVKNKLISLPSVFEVK